MTKYVITIVDNEIVNIEKLPAINPTVWPGEGLPGGSGGNGGGNGGG